jgi:hypothetical protein
MPGPYAKDKHDAENDKQEVEIPNTDNEKDGSQPSEQPAKRKKREITIKASRPG